MFIDASKLPSGETVIQSDVCIIGAGPAGITLARDLANDHLTVNVLEGGDLTGNPKTQSLFAGENVGRPYYPLDTSRVRYFGGSANHWLDEVGLRSRPLDASDFEAHDWLPNSGWPFDRAHLDPFYERAHVVCGLGPFEYDVERWQERTDESPLPLDNGPVVTTMFQFGPRDVFRSYREAFARSATLNAYLNANVVEIECLQGSELVSGLRALTLNGKVIRASARAYVIAAGGIENARVLLLSNRRFPEGLGNRHDLVGRFFMEHIHLTSGRLLPSRPDVLEQVKPYLKQRRGGVESMYALAISPDARREGRLGNVSVWLRPETRASAARGVRAFRELVAAARHRRRHTGFWNELRSLIIQADHRQALGWLLEARNMASDFDKLGLTVWRKLTGRYGQHPELVQLTVIAEQSPNPESRVTLGSAKDRLGQKRVRLDWRLSDQDFHTIVAGQRLIAVELGRAGLGSVEGLFEDERPPPRISGGWHHMGTTRMHDDPRRGVVDANCRVHGMRNLYIAGSSVFPTCGCSNPTLTIVALAIRLADHLRVELRRA